MIKLLAIWDCFILLVKHRFNLKTAKAEVDRDVENISKDYYKKADELRHEIMKSCV